MNSVKLARLLTFLAVFVMISGFVMMGKKALQPNLINLAINKSEQAFLDGSYMSISEYADDEVTLKKTESLINGEIQRPVLLENYVGSQLFRSQILSRFPLWNRPPIKRMTRYLPLKGKKLFYDIGPTKINYQKANLYFRYVIVSDEELTFESHEIKLTYDVPFTWLHNAVFQVKGDQLAVVVPGTPTDNKDGKEQVLAFVISLTDGSLVEQKVLNKKAIFGTESVSFDSGDAYHPETMIVKQQNMTDKTTSKNEGTQYLSYDYFSDTVTSIRIEQESDEVFSYYITGPNIYFVKQKVQQDRTTGYPLTTQKWVPVQERQPVIGDIYSASQDGEATKIMSVNLDSYSHNTMTLAEGNLVYIGLDNHQNNVTVIDLSTNKKLLQAPITYQTHNPVRFNAEVLIY